MVMGWWPTLHNENSAILPARRALGHVELVRYRESATKLMWELPGPRGEACRLRARNGECGHEQCPHGSSVARHRRRATVGQGNRWFGALRCDLADEYEPATRDHRQPH